MREKLFGGGGVPARQLRSDVTWDRNSLKKVIGEKNGSLGERIMNQDKQLKEIISFSEYLSVLKRIKNKLIIFCVKDTAGFHFSENMGQKMSEINLMQDLCNAHWRGYIGIINNGKTVYERRSQPNEAIEYAHTINGTRIEVKSKPFKAGNQAYIGIDDIDYARNCRGMNIVVYDMERVELTDSVCFDTHSPDIRCSREKPGIYEERKIRLEYAGRLSLKEILPPKTEVRILFTGEIHLWNTIKSVAKAFHEDRRFHTVIVVMEPPNYGKKEEKKSYAEGEGYEVSYYDKRDLEESDILISAPFDHISNWMRNSKMTIVIPFVLVKKCTSIAMHIEGLAAKGEGASVDYYIFDKLIYGEIQKNNLLQKNYILIGNPKFDEIYEKMQEEAEWPQGWEKLKGKKIILWTTDHVWNSGNVTFDLYAREIFGFLEENPDMGLIFRPHPVYLAELKRNGFWSESDVSRLRQYFEKSVNMVWDEFHDYSLAYKVSDAILLDANCGIIVSALATKKPMCVLRRYDGRACEIFHPEVVDKLYLAESREQCINFLNEVANGVDSKEREREKAFEEYISYFDGKNGQRIKDFVTEKYFEKYGEERRQ